MRALGVTKYLELKHQDRVDQLTVGAEFTTRAIID